MRACTTSRRNRCSLPLVGYCLLPASANTRLSQTRIYLGLQNLWLCNVIGIARNLIQPIEYFNQRALQVRVDRKHQLIICARLPTQSIPFLSGPVGREERLPAAR